MFIKRGDLWKKAIVFHKNKHNLNFYVKFEYDGLKKKRITPEMVIKMQIKEKLEINELQMIKRSRRPRRDQNDVKQENKALPNITKTNITLTRCVKLLQLIVFELFIIISSIFFFSVYENYDRKCAQPDSYFEFADCHNLWEAFLFTFWRGYGLSFNYFSNGMSNGLYLFEKIYIRNVIIPFNISLFLILQFFLFLVFCYRLILYNKTL